MEENALSDNQYAILFDIRRSIRYHERRKVFYEFWSTATTWLALMFGSATFATYTSTEQHFILAKLFAGIVTATTSFDLLVGFSKKAYLHNA